MRMLAVFLLLILSGTTAYAQNPYASVDGLRREMRLRKGWKFTREDSPAFAQRAYNDASWQGVVVPHDWAVYGPFSAQNDRQHVAITQDGQTDALEHAGRTGGLPFVGVGWYRTRFELPTDIAVPGSVTLRFDGAMSHAKVYVNGQYAGEQAYGYNSFHLDVTHLVDRNATEQIIAVRLENPSDFSRWYPGAGLYRNVYVVVTPSEARIAEWGTYVTTPVINREYAQVKVLTTVNAPSPEAMRRLTLKTTLLDGDRRIAASSISVAAESYGGKTEQNLRLPYPKLWGIGQPNLYVALSELYDGDKLIDSYRTTFGVRKIEVVPDKGFFLNDSLVKFKGVCLHHDLGPLGSAVNMQAIRRQIRIMQEMGANSIRTSHNMPAPEVVQVANEMGMMLMVETFDEWRIPKVKNGYNLLFDTWAERDLVAAIHHFRNDPSVVMWCIGNEVYEQGAEGGNKVAHFLQSICHREDPTRPVTQGMDNPTAVVKNNFASIMDVAGFNYRPWHYPEAYKSLPQQIVLGTETCSTVSSRGVYKFPVERRAMAKYPDHQASSYDVEHCGWSNLPEDDFMRHDDYHYNIGEFVWTGFDYIGEPTPYYTDWPSHSSLFGIVDLAGIPKDRYYLYRSHWNSGEETLHILPHWSWHGREGEVTPIFVYTNYPTAELFINGMSQGRRTKDLTLNTENSDDKGLERQKRYRLMWMDTRYEPGEVRVVAYDHNGNVAATKVMRTPGKPYALKLMLENDNISADGEDLAFVRVQVVDRDGTLCPTATHKVTFRVKGNGSYRASANGDPTCVVPFHERTMPLFAGEMTTIVQAGETPGVAHLTATAPGLRSASIRINVR